MVRQLQDGREHHLGKGAGTEKQSVSCGFDSGEEVLSDEAGQMRHDVEDEERCDAFVGEP